MGKPIFIIAGQSNARRISGEVEDALTQKYGADGYVLVKSYVGGAPLTWQADGKRDWATSDELPSDVIAQARHAIADNPDGVSGGMIWVQGEADTWDKANPAQYQHALTALFDRISSELSVGDSPAAQSFANMKAVISQLADFAPDGSTRPHWVDIISAQKKAARLSDDITSVDPDSLAAATGFTQDNMFVDGLHYSGAFSRVLADRLVERVAALSDIGTDLPDGAIGQRAEPVRMIGTHDGEDLIGSAGDDVIKGQGGNDLIAGESGADRLIGGGATDEISGGSGGDVLFGLAGADSLSGDNGADWLYGGRDDDILRGGDGGDWLRGNIGDDNLFGDAGRDDLRGGTGDDMLHGGADADFLLGEAGRDRLDGGAGNDVLTGGKGGATRDGVDDIFVYRGTADGAGGFDRVKDFEDGIDRIDLSSFDLPGFAALQDHLETANGGQDLRINFGSGDVLYLDGVQLAELTADDIIF